MSFPWLHKVAYTVEILVVCPVQDGALLVLFNRHFAYLHDSHWITWDTEMLWFCLFVVQNAATLDQLLRRVGFPDIAAISSIETSWLQIIPLDS